MDLEPLSTWEARVEDWLQQQLCEASFELDIVSFSDLYTTPPPVHPTPPPQDVADPPQVSQQEMHPPVVLPELSQEDITLANEEEVLSELCDLLDTIDNTSEISVHLSDYTFPDSLPDLGCLELHLDENDNLPPPNFME